MQGTKGDRVVPNWELDTGRSKSKTTSLSSGLFSFSGNVWNFIFASHEFSKFILVHRVGLPSDRASRRVASPSPHRRCTWTIALVCQGYEMFSQSCEVVAENPGINFSQVVLLWDQLDGCCPHCYSLCAPRWKFSSQCVKIFGPPNAQGRSNCRKRKRRRAVFPQ